MNRTKISGKAKNAVVLIKRTAAFFICSTKYVRIDNLLSDRRSFHFSFEKKLNATVALRKNVGIFFFTKGGAPDIGASPFSRSTKYKYFRHEKNIGYCNSSILLEILRLQHRFPKQHFSPMR